MSRKPYPTDLTDQQWQLIASLIPAAKDGGRPSTVDVREILNAIFYILTSGCAWRLMPQDKRHLGRQFTITFYAGELLVSDSR